MLLILKLYFIIKKNINVILPDILPIILLIIPVTFVRSGVFNIFYFLDRTVQVTGVILLDTSSFKIVLRNVSILFHFLLCKIIATMLNLRLFNQSPASSPSSQSWKLLAASPTQDGCSSAIKNPVLDYTFRSLVYMILL